MIPLWMTTMRPVQSRCGWAAVRGPAGVRDPVPAVDRLLRKHLLEVAELPGRAPDRQLTVPVDDRDTGGVVAAVLELAQSLDQDLDRLLGSDVSDDPAHG